MSVTIQRRKTLDVLPARREPHWGARLQPKRYIGYRKIDAQRGSWIARAPDPDTGKNIYKALGADAPPAFGYDAAVKAATDWFAELDAGVVTRGRFTLEDACKEYVEELRRQKRDKAAADAEWRFERGGITGESFGRTEVAELRTPDLKRWRDALLIVDEEGRQMGKAGANRTFAVLRAALNLAVTNNRVPASTMQAWRAVKQFRKADGRREIFLDLAQRRALLEAAPGAVRDLLEAALLTGARPGELVSASRAQLDLRTKTLTLRGKTGERAIPLTGATLALFERLGKSKLPAALLLTRDDGQPWTRMEWSRAIRAVVEATTVKDGSGKETKLPPGVVLYSCRHTFITQALQDGLTTADVAHFVGSSLQMLQDHYSQFVQSAVRERIAAVQML